MIISAKTILVFLIKGSFLAVLMIVLGCSNQNSNKLDCIINDEKNASVIQGKDICQNYAGNQSQKILKKNGFVVKNKICFLQHNHANYARLGFDKIKINGLNAEGMHIGLIDINGIASGEKIIQNGIIHKTIAEHSSQIAKLITDKNFGLANQAYLHYYPVKDKSGFESQKQNFYSATIKALHNDANLIAIMQPNDMVRDIFVPSNYTKKVLELLEKKEVVMILAAGNEGANLSNYIKSNVQAYDFLKEVFNNKKLSGKFIITGSFDVEMNKISINSNYPGEITELKSRFILGASDNLKLPTLAGDSMQNISGTSYAVPQIASAMAILLAMDTTLKPTQAAQIILESANKNLDHYEQECSNHNNQVVCGDAKHGRGLLDISAAVKKLNNDIKLRCI